MRILLETIVSSLDDARAAWAGGADRFELCSALALGGLTPSLGLLGIIRAEMDVPVMFMVRPREGGMAYSEADFLTMLMDAAIALEEGAAGIVTGLLTPEGDVDVPRCRKLLGLVDEAAGHVDRVFHRAYDVVRDPEAALEQIIDLGFTRVLTSGRAGKAADGLDEIARTVRQADGRIQVLPGGGIRPDGVAEVVRRTGVDQVHLSLTEVRTDLSPSGNPAVHFGVNLPATELEHRVTSEELVRQVRRTLDELPERGARDG